MELIHTLDLGVLCLPLLSFAASSFASQVSLSINPLYSSSGFSFLTNAICGNLFSSGKWDTCNAQHALNGDYSNYHPWWLEMEYKWRAKLWEIKWLEHLVPMVTVMIAKDVARATCF